MPQNIAKVSHAEVGLDETGQRLDNWLLARLKGVPRSLVYRIIRSGEVRVNKGRAKASSRVQAGDVIRIPPLRQDLPPADDAAPPDGMLAALERAVIYRDSDILGLNKPPGMAVHAGSGLRHGVIDAVRQLWGEDWQLAHRLDRDTSGCLLLLRRRELLREFQALLAAGQVHKDYLALVHGVWPAEVPQRLESRLARSAVVAGERRVQSGDDGQLAVSHVARREALLGASLLAVRIETGRTHQIRVQLAEAGHPVVGDAKYGRRELDRGLGLKATPGLCLHAAALSLPLAGRELAWQAPLPEGYATLVRKLGGTP